MRAILPSLAWALVALFHGAPAWATQALQHDPFTRPLLTAPVPAGPAGANPAVADVPWRPTLNAVLVAGPDSLVNVAGFVIKVGEEIDGYRLTQVSEGKAVFVKKKRRIVLKMNVSDSDKNNPRGTE